MRKLYIPSGVCHAPARRHGLSSALLEGTCRWGVFLTVVFGILALGVVFLWCIRHAELIQTGVAASATSALASADIEFAAVSASGQHVTLTGTAPSEVERLRAAGVVRTAPGVTRVCKQPDGGGGPRRRRAPIPRPPCCPGSASRLSGQPPAIRWNLAGGCPMSSAMNCCNGCNQRGPNSPLLVSFNRPAVHRWPCARRWW